MISAPRALADITQEAIALLCRELGVVNTARFLNQYSLGYGDYTAEREGLFDQLTVNQIVEEIKRNRASTSD